MRILIVGARGDIGKAACAELGQRHDLIAAGRTSGDVRLDMSDMRSVTVMFAEVGKVDAVVSTAGDVHFAALTDQTSDSLLLGLREKVMGQVNLVLAGIDCMADGGSFTLTSGVLDRDPIPMGTGGAMANGALAGFATGAAIELPRGLRINVVSPGLLESSVDRYGPWFAGHVPVSEKRVGLAYAKSVEGAGTGKVIIVE